ncbi:uncharacterized protein M6B38_169925 [Iris pallida]|uniref:Uncharacterized protein n=1 Tax=Iris pallida TaxID=29817 RepID=A0AAX6EV22_IRIPA|nr:uncharacterized protein M6B38_169920 [Iris pallida]KAJ6807925.1 uncharacterized protein M6B38_169925 [Iris pallida]
MLTLFIHPHLIYFPIPSSSPYFSFLLIEKESPNQKSPPSSSPTPFPSSSSSSSFLIPKTLSQSQTLTPNPSYFVPKP